MNPPFAVLYVLLGLTKHPIKKPFPVFLFQIPSSTSESMRTCFTEGGVCDMQGNLVDPGPLLLGIQVL